MMEVVIDVCGTDWEWDISFVNICSQLVKFWLGGGKGFCCFSLNILFNFLIPGLLKNIFDVDQNIEIINTVLK